MNLHDMLNLVPGLSKAAERELEKIQNHLSDDSHKSGCHLDLKISFQPEPKREGEFRAVGEAKAVFPKQISQSSVIISGGHLKLKPEADQNQTGLDLDAHGDPAAE